MLCQIPPPLSRARETHHIVIGERNSPHGHRWSAGSENKQRINTANKARVRMLQCVIMALDRNPVEFAAFLPPFLALYSTNALTAPDAAGVNALPAKRRVLLTTFLARALVSAHYEPDKFKYLKLKCKLFWLL